MEALRRTLSRLTDAHRVVLATARAATCRCPEAIQNLGAALVVHGTMLDGMPEPARTLLDDNVIDAIRADGASIADNLAHLASLSDSDPDSPEIETLAPALLERIQLHLEWNDRAVFGPLSRFYLETKRSRQSEHIEAVRNESSSTGDQHERDS